MELADIRKAVENGSCLLHVESESVGRVIRVIESGQQDKNILPPIIEFDDGNKFLFSETSFVELPSCSVAFRDDCVLMISRCLNHMVAQGATLVDMDADTIVRIVVGVFRQQARVMGIQS
jgi:hypothetical protein